MRMVPGVAGSQHFTLGQKPAGTETRPDEGTYSWEGDSYTEHFYLSVSLDKRCSLRLVHNMENMSHFWLRQAELDLCHVLSLQI